MRYLGLRGGRSVLNGYLEIRTFDLIVKNFFLILLTLPPFQVSSR